MGLWTGRALARAALSFITGENPYVTDRARDELDWIPRVAAREAIARTVRWSTTNEKPG
jgi:nucleoside-diphosphate-sugar epimerase